MVVSRWRGWTFVGRRRGWTFVRWKGWGGWRLQGLGVGRVERVERFGSSWKVRWSWRFRWSVQLLQRSSFACSQLDIVCTVAQPVMSTLSKFTKLNESCKKRKHPRGSWSLVYQLLYEDGTFLLELCLWGVKEVSPSSPCVVNSGDSFWPVCCLSHSFPCDYN